MAKERVDRKSWFSAKDASTYREEAQELLAIVEVCYSMIHFLCTCQSLTCVVVQDNSSNLRAKETFLRNNLSSSTRELLLRTRQLAFPQFSSHLPPVNSVVIISFNEDGDLPLHNVSSNAGELISSPFVSASG